MKRLLIHLIILVLLDLLITLAIILYALRNIVLLESGIYLLSLELLFGFVVHNFTWKSMTRRVNTAFDITRTALIESL